MLRIGAVSYLNTKPLIHSLAARLGGEGVLTLDLPSRLATDLAAGKLDVALIPSIEYFRNPGYQIISDAVIACRGPVWSVRLLSRVPTAEIKRLALDEGSRTSAALVRTLLWEMHGLEPQLMPLPIDRSPDDMDADAVLLIGDRAMRPSAGVYHEIWDLGDRWCRWTELPFVFAMWVARPTADRGGAEIDKVKLADMLEASRDDGLANLAEIAAAESAAHGLTTEDLHRYFAEHLHFRLGPGERLGLETFRQRAAKLGLIPNRPAVSVVTDSPFSDNLSNHHPPMIATAKPIEHSVRSILDRAIAGDRLTTVDAARLLESHDLAAIGSAADQVSRRMHPEPYRTYNVDRNINYTNICTAVCDFCAFYRSPKSDEGYVLSRAELLQKVEETVALGGNQILMQGGLHPKFKLDWYEELLRDIKAAFPDLNIHGFSPPELHHFSKVNHLPIREVLERLKIAGLGSIPGGGAEILVDRVRREITRGKVLSDDWLNVMRVWHQLGGISTATMMFGHVETLAERIEHLDRVRQLQDETGGFTAFICWTFQPENTEMSHITPAGSFEYLKTLAVSRLFLDNVPNIQSSWVTQGLKIGQLAMLFGANDMGSLMIEENVVAEAGTVHFLTLGQIRDAIRELGFEPRQRDVFYHLVSREQEQKAIDANEHQDPRQLVQVGH
jgi:cyclic dehypoxanthinyl futalosine synthase